MLSVVWCSRSQPLLIISSFGEDEVLRVDSGRWVVGCSLINEIYRPETSLLWVITVDLYWHTGGFHQEEERMLQ